MRATRLLCMLALFGCQPAAEKHVAQVQANAPMRVVSLTPGITELLYAVGAEQTLVATVEYADYPEAAKQLPRIGDGLHIDAERLLALKPDLVLTGGGLTPSAVAQQIKTLGLRTESIESRRLAVIGAALLRLGELTGHQEQARQVAGDFARKVQELRQRYAGRAPLNVFIEVNRQPLYTVNGQEIISEAVQACGGVNVFASLNRLAPTVGVEAVLRINPQVIVSTDGTLAQLQDEWNAWPQLQAVKQKRLYVVSPDTVTRAAPRLLQGMQQVCEALEQARNS